MSQEQTDALLNELRAFRDDCQRDNRVDMTVGANHCISIVENWIASRLEWQPIATAPRDGTSVLGCEGDTVCGVHSNSNDIWWWDLGDPAHPTHWMPLPEPPKGA